MPFYYVIFQYIFDEEMSLLSSNSEQLVRVNELKTNLNKFWAYEPSAYEILGVSESDTLMQINSVYRQMVVQIHPDKNRHKSAEEQEEIEKMFKAVTKAYKTIVSVRRETNAPDYNIDYEVTSDNKISQEMLNTVKSLWSRRSELMEDIRSHRIDDDVKEWMKVCVEHRIKGESFDEVFVEESDEEPVAPRSEKIENAIFNTLFEIFRDVGDDTESLFKTRRATTGNIETLLEERKQEIEYIFPDYLPVETRKVTKELTIYEQDNNLMFARKPQMFTPSYSSIVEVDNFTNGLLSDINEVYEHNYEFLADSLKSLGYQDRTAKLSDNEFEAFLRSREVENAGVQKMHDEKHGQMHGQMHGPMSGQMSGQMPSQDFGPGPGPMFSMF